MDNRHRLWLRSGIHVLCGAMLLGATTVSPAEEPKTSAPLQTTVEGGVSFVLAAQAADGSWSKQTGPSVTALVATALLRHGRTVNDPAVAKALKYIEGFAQPDGGIHHPKSTFRNYETCVAVMCFKEANKDQRYDKLLKKADAFLKHLQWDESKSIDKSSPNYGGAGYEKDRRPDLSNTQYFVEALRELGNGPDDEHVKKALIFIPRCQNLESEHNTTPNAGKVNDGGFYYTPAEGGSSAAEKLPNGGLRSYGSMTYAGLKSMIHAGLKPDDPRVKAAVEWVTKNYDLKSNPGVGAAGLYYYYHTFAKALDAIGYDTFKDAEGKTHDWRKELVDELARRQQPNGSWVNDNNRWLEGNDHLTTAFALLALSHCRPRTP